MGYFGLLRKLIMSSPFLRHNAVFFMGSLGVAALNYLYYPVLGRMLPPAEFGEVQTLVSIFTQAAIFLSILTYVTVHITVNARNEAERNETLLALEHSALLAGGAVLGVSLLGVPLLQSFFHFSSVWPFIALIAALGLSIPLMVRMSYLRGRKQYLKSSLADGVGSAAKLILSAVLVVVGLKSFGAMIGLALSQILSLAVATWWAYRAGLRGFGLKRSHLNMEALRPQLRYAGAVFLALASVTALFSLDMFAIKHYFSPEQAGLYAGMTTVARIVFFVTAPFTGVLLTMVGLKQSRAKNLLWLFGTLVLTCTVGGAAVLFLVMLPELTIRLLVGGKYLMYAQYLPKLALAMLLLGIANTLLMYQIALRRYTSGFLAIAVTFFTVVFVAVRHNVPGQVVDDVLVGSTALAGVAVIMMQKYKLLSKD